MWVRRLDQATDVQLLGHWETWRVTMSSRETTLVLPFYLSMMRTNATAVDERLWDDLVVVGRTATVDDVLWLLRVGAWRPVVMGAWLSLRFDRGQVGAAVSHALQESEGSLTAPPLAVAAVTILGEDAVTPLRQSKARSDEPSVPILDAALKALGSDEAREVNEQNRVVFAEMVAVGKRLRAALTGP